MKKILLSAITFMMSAVFALGCSANKQSVSESAEVQTSAASESSSYMLSDEKYSIQDIKNLSS